MATHQTLLNNIKRFIDLDHQEIEIFLSLINQKEIKKKEFLLQERQVCKYQYFVAKGCLKKYKLDNQGVEHVSMFAIEDYWTGDILSFTKEIPSHYFIQALEMSSFYVLSKDNLSLLYQKVPKFEKFFRILYQRSLASYVERSDQNISLTAEEKYLNFLNKYPTLESRISQKNIASYLGITPEFLSLLKKRLRKK